MLDMTLEGIRIDSVDIRGDFLVERQGDLTSLLQELKGRTIPEAITAVRHSRLRKT